MKKMKKIIALVLALACAVALAACGGGMEEHFEQLEYVSYCDLFYNGNTADYANKKFTKTGTFAAIRDMYNDGITRYYVWGYADTTKCCCYQWEFVAPDGWEIPENGSTITVKGTLKANTEALDGYWFEDCTVTTDKAFTSPDVDYDLTRISPTLVYVQIANMLQFPDEFNDKTMRVYGRALTAATIQHPYYDNMWQLDFVWTGDVPAIGQYMVIDGAFSVQNGSGILNASSLQFVD